MNDTGQADFSAQVTALASARPGESLPVPHLEVVELAALCVHEWYDEQRTPPLVQRMRSSGVFRNPPIVAPMEDGSGRYLVLDGANRTAALRALGSRHILVQMVLRQDPGLRLRTWNHVLFELAPAALLAGLRAIPDLDVAGSDEATIDLPSRHSVGVALLQTPDGRVYGLSAPTLNLAGRIAMLNAIVDTYKRIARLDRTTFAEVGQLGEVYAGLTGLVIFPKFDLRDLVEIVNAGGLLPPGITRTTVAPRSLYINYPLDELLGDGLLPEKNARLQKLVAQRLEQGRVAYYGGATYLFDE
jgi:hypothetical protein